MGAILTKPEALVHSVRVGRRQIEDKIVAKVNLTPEDLRYIEAVGQHFGLGDRSATLRFAVRELARRERLKVEIPTQEGG